jgi:hypothetical protein
LRLLGKWRETARVSYAPARPQSPRDIAGLVDVLSPGVMVWRRCSATNSPHPDPSACVHGVAESPVTWGLHDSLLGSAGRARDAWAAQCRCVGGVRVESPPAHYSCSWSLSHPCASRWLIRSRAMIIVSSFVYKHLPMSRRISPLDGTSNPQPPTPGPLLSDIQSLEGFTRPTPWSTPNAVTTPQEPLCELPHLRRHRAFRAVGPADDIPLYRP